MTVPQTADFGEGPVSGRIVEVRLAAPPASFAVWQQAFFPGESNPALIGPDATPLAGSLPNLLHYALGIPASAKPQDYLPHLGIDGGISRFRFPFDPGRDDIACLVEASAVLDDWENADILFDSRSDLPSGLDQGWLTVTAPATAPRRFYRLRVLQR